MAKNDFEKYVKPNEILWVRYADKGKLKYILVSNRLRDKYSLYEITDKDRKLVKSDESSVKLEKYVKYD